jgi:pyruvate dehydrogenase E1 component alpha subunit
MNVRQPVERDRGMIARSHGIFTDKGDGNDVQEVFEKTSMAIKHVREGNGPAFLEFLTYRQREHCGPEFDPETLFREQYCPIHRLKNQCQEHQFEAEISEEIDQAFQFAEQSSFPQCDL